MPHLCLAVTIQIVKDVQMNIKKTMAGLTLSLLLDSGVAVAADFNKGLKTAHSR